MHINICQLEGFHPKSTTAATAELKHSDIRRVGIYWQDVCHLGGHWYCHIFVSKHFHQKMKTKERLFNFQSSPTAVPLPNFLELSRAIEEPAVRRSQAFDMMWMKLKLNGAPKRNRSRWCSEIWEYQKQNCKGACANFLVSDGPFGSATKINPKKWSKIFWDKKVCYEKSSNSLGVLDY